MTYRCSLQLDKWYLWNIHNFQRHIKFERTVNCHYIQRTWHEEKHKLLTVLYPHPMLLELGAKEIYEDWIVFLPKGPVHPPRMETIEDLGMPMPNWLKSMNCSC